MYILLLALLGGGALQAAEPAPVVAVVSDQLLAEYDAVRLALSQDKLDEGRAAAARLAAAHSDDPALLAAAQAVTAGADAAAMRQAFSELSRLLVLRIAASSPSPKVLAYHCPMWSGYAWWIQLKSGISNPYMGQAMPTCGEETSLKAAIKAAGT